MVCALALPLFGGEVSISGFRDGQITISNSACIGVPTFYSIEWRSDLGQGSNWTNSWVDLGQIRSTNSSLTLPVPMFFRATAYADNLTTQPDALWEMFSNAVVDASNAVPSKVARNLTPVVLSNTNLSWRTNLDGTLQVKVCGFMSSSTATKLYPIGRIYPNYGDLWVTLYPELKNFCRDFQGPDRLMRVKQVLGINPSSANDTILEFWVSPDFLFRPTPEPAVNSVSAGVASSVSAPRITSSYRVVSFWADWYNNAYNVCNYGMVGGISSPRAWTRLGYTYDWASTRPNHQGLSEFVVPSGMLFSRQNVQPIVDVEAHIPAISYGLEQ